jgi:hypothetical protein
MRDQNWLCILELLYKKRTDKEVTITGKGKSVVMSNGRNVQNGLDSEEVFCEALVSIMRCLKISSDIGEGWPLSCQHKYKF